MHLDPARLAQPDRYKLLIGGIVPRPIAWVSTLSPSGAPNLAPFSFFAGVSSEPMSLLFCPANKADGEPKDTLKNIEAMGQFVVNIVPHALARTMAACAEPLPYEQSEWALAGLQSEPSVRIKPARVTGTPVAFECERMQVIRLAPGEPGGGNIVIGRIVSVFVRDDAINERLHLDPALIDAIGRMGGLSYCTTRERFDMPMGREALR